MPKLYPVQLSPEDRSLLEQLLQQSPLSLRQRRRVQILLAAEEGESDTDIADALECGVSTVERTRKRFATEGLDAALGEHPRPGATPVLDGKAEALLIELACSQPPQGQARWTLRQLGQKLVALEVVETVSHETIRRVLKKTNSSLGRSVRGACRR
jgi:putative transposase